MENQSKLTNTVDFLVDEVLHINILESLAKSLLRNSAQNIKLTTQHISMQWAV